MPTRASIRLLLGKALKTDAELQAFCLDHFPEVAERYSDNMDRLIKMNLLLDCVAADQLMNRLAATSPGILANYSHIISYTHERENQFVQIDTVHTRRNRLRMLTKIRKFWIEGVLESSLHGLLPIELEKESWIESRFRPWDLVQSYPQKNPQPVPKGKRMLDLYDEHWGELLLLGAPGAGKTTMLLELCRDLLVRAEQEPAAPIPVVLSLSTWAQKSLPIAEWIIDELSLRYDVPATVGMEWCRAGLLVPLLDGLDELRAEFRSSCVAALNRYRQVVENPGLVVCCRQLDHEALTQPLHIEAAIRLNPLSVEQIAKRLEQAGISHGQLLALLGSDSSLNELACSPLFLNILIRVMRGQTGDALPVQADSADRRRDLFGAYFLAVMTRRKFPSRYSPQRTLCYLCEIARRLCEQNQSAFYLEDMQPSRLQTRMQSLAYRLIPTSILYFIINMLVFGLSFVSVSIYPHWFGLDLSSIPMWVHLLSAISSTINSIILSLYYEPIEQARSALGFRWSWSMLGSGILPAMKTGIRRCLINNIIVSFSATIIALLYFQLHSTNHVAAPLGIHSPWSLLLVFVVQYIIYYISFSIVCIPACVCFEVFKNSISHDVIYDRQIPNQDNIIALRRVLKLVGCLIGFQTVISLLGFSNMGMEHRRLLQVVLGLLSMALPAFLVLIIPHVGGLAVARHYAIRLLLAMQDVLPLRLVSFLDFATERVLLRRVGGSYVFIHRLFSEYFATLSPDERRHLEAGTQSILQQRDQTRNNKRPRSRK